MRSTPPEISDQGYALFFARLEAYKGIDVLLEAMQQLASIAPTARAIIAGKGDLQCSRTTGYFACCGRTSQSFDR